MHGRFPPGTGPLSDHAVIGDIPSIAIDLLRSDIPVGS